MKTATSLSTLHPRCGGRTSSFMALALAALLGTAVASAQTAPPISHSATPVAGAHPQAAALPARHGEEEESEAKPNDTSHQGIKIHGHWKIDIKNPDGSLASTHEFENSLYDGGGLFSYLLTSRATSGEAAILLFAGLNASPICTSTTQNYDCVITETSTGYWATGTYCKGNPGACAFNLNPSLAIQYIVCGSCVAGQVQVVLSGSIVATSSTSIGTVETAFASCSSATGYATVTPAQCHSGTVPPGTNINSLPQGSQYFNGVLTNKNLATAIPVLSGQTIQVTVTLSFS